MRQIAQNAAETLVAHPDIANDEIWTRAALIQPLMKSLGYDTTNPEHVKLEVPTEVDGKIDYILMGETKELIAVEAKRAGLRLSDKGTKQLRSYFTFTDAVAAILTNGIDYWLFTDLHKKNVMDAEPYRKIDIRNLTDNDLRHLEGLQRSEVTQEAVHAQAQQEQYQGLINTIVAQELNAPSPEFLRMIGKKVGIKPLTKTNLDMLQPLVAVAIRRASGESTSEILSPVTIASPPAPKPPPTRPKGTIPPFQSGSLFDVPLDARSYPQMLKAVVAELQSRHTDFEEVVSDRKKFRGRKFWMISRNEEDLSPSRSKVHVGGYWVDINLNRKNLIRRAHHFLQTFGHSPEDLVIHPKDDSTPA